MHLCFKKIAIDLQINLIKYFGYVTSNLSIIYFKIIQK